MKVLSLMEPWASLIANNKKCIETRSWKTNYRGDLYIHASKKKVNFKDTNINKIIELLGSNDFKYGSIICKCKLVDCIHMNETYVEEIKNNKIEYMCGDFAVGRYAWILQDMQMLDNPIYTNGRLNIWEYDMESYNGICYR